jgi:homoserine kinase
LLPQTVPHRDAAANAARAALLVAAVTVRPELLFAATEDRLHQAYRAPAMPETAALLDKLRGAAVPAVVSGAGPTVLALCVESTASDAAELAEADGWAIHQLPVDASGVTAVSEDA